MNYSFEKTKTPTPFVKENKLMNSFSDEGLFRGKNLIIVILVGLLIFSFLGLNLLLILGDFFQVVINLFSPLVSQILAIFGYTTGTVLDKSEDVVTSVAKTGIDIAGGTLDSIADILKNLSKNKVDSEARSELDRALSSKGSSVLNTQPEPDTSSAAIQKPITSGKSKWCLVGEYEGKRGCVEVDDASKCLSGQVFPTLHSCMNPTKTVYMHSHAAA
tara:strand:- start:2265 stop:2915 length:651 start_codon:yes stop_codon:yes gene_type:complete